MISVFFIKLFLMISMDNGTIVFILLLVWFKTETDVGIILLEQFMFCSDPDFRNAFCALHLVLIWFRSIFSCLSTVSTDDACGCHDLNFSVLSFLWFTLETDLQVDEGSARDWFFTTRC